MVSTTVVIWGQEHRIYNDHSLLNKAFSSGKKKATHLVFQDSGLGLISDGGKCQPAHLLTLPPVVGGCTSRVWPGRWISTQDATGVHRGQQKGPGGKIQKKLPTGPTTVWRTFCLSRVQDCAWHPCSPCVLDRVATGKAKHCPPRVPHPHPEGLSLGQAETGSAEGSQGLS